MKPINAILLDIFFPTDCIICNKKGVALCIDCINTFPEAERESAIWIFPLFDYRHPPVRRIVQLLKYKGKRILANNLAEIMNERILEELGDLEILENFKNPILIPIPLAPKRLRARGFNQSELICTKLIQINKNKNFILGKNILKKPKDTIHQANIHNRNIRLKNIIGSFIVKNPEKIKSRNIILIDDVTTTGATLNEAKKVLKQAGARKIIAFTIAH